jgi:hypothetical protein
MAGSKVLKGEIVTTGQENPLGVASELPVQDAPMGSPREKQKIRASEVVIIILLVLLVLCCCCACLASGAVLRLIWLGLAGLFSGVPLPIPSVY